MRILIIADDSFASREQAMLTRLGVGIAGEGIRIAQAMPKRSVHRYSTEVFSQIVAYEDRGLVISRGWRCRQVVRELAVQGESLEIDIVHAFGLDSWGMASELARRFEAALALEIHSLAAAHAIRGVRAGLAGVPLYFLLPDAVLDRAVRGDDVGVQARVTPWGVHTPPAAREVLGREISIMLLASGRDRAAIITALEGLAEIVKSRPGLMIFAADPAIAQAGGWALIRRLGLTDRVTLVPDMEARRELTLRGDILLLPESLGEHRSLTLDAMAAGMLVLAAADPMAPILSDARTARLVHRPGAPAWREALEWVLGEPGAVRTLAGAAREHVKAHCRASSHVASVVGAYEWMTAGASIPFTGPP